MNPETAPANSLLLVAVVCSLLSIVAVTPAPTPSCPGDPQHCHEHHEYYACECVSAEANYTVDYEVVGRVIFKCPADIDQVDKQAIEAFGIRLGTIRELHLSCPLGAAVDLLDALGVDAVKEPLEVRWGHMRLPQDHDHTFSEDVRLRSLKLTYQQGLPNGEDDKWLDPKFGRRFGGVGIESLSLQFAPIGRLPETSLRGLSNLRSLAIQDCRSELRLFNSAFADLGSLTQLSLHKCHMRSIDAELLQPLSALETLDLGRNAFADLPDGLFASNGRLTSISLVDSWTGERTLRRGFLRGVSKLERFLYSSPKGNATFRDPDFFAGCANYLENVSVQHSRLPNNDLSIFQGLEKLRILDARHNRLSALNFSPPPHLERIALGSSHTVSGANVFNCSCENVQDFRKILGQIDKRYPVKLVNCSSEENDTKVDVFDTAKLHETCPISFYSQLRAPLSAVAVALVLLCVLLALATLRRRHRVYQMHRGSIGHFEYDAFVSYGTTPDVEAGDDDPEEDFVVRLIELLEEGGDIRINFHRETFEVGLDIADNVRRQMSLSRCVLAVVSRSMVASEHCDNEFCVARDLQKKVLVVMRTGEHAPSGEDLRKHEMVRCLVEKETYLEEVDDDGDGDGWKKQVDRLRRRLITMRDAKEDKVGKLVDAIWKKLRAATGRGERHVHGKEQYEGLPMQTTPTTS